MRGVRALVAPVLALLVTPVALVATRSTRRTAWAGPSPCRTSPAPARDRRWKVRRAGAVRGAAADRDRERPRSRGGGARLGRRPRPGTAARPGAGRYRRAAVRSIRTRPGRRWPNWHRRSLSPGPPGKSGPLSCWAAGTDCLRATGVQRLTVDTLGQPVPRLLVRGVGRTTLSLTPTSTDADLVLRLGQPVAGLAATLPLALPLSNADLAPLRQATRRESDSTAGASTPDAAVEPGALPHRTS
jgi:hypothetical protein